MSQASSICWPASFLKISSYGFIATPRPYFQTTPLKRGWLGGSSWVASMEVLGSNLEVGSSSRRQLLFSQVSKGEYLLLFRPATSNEAPVDEVFLTSIERAYFHVRNDLPASGRKTFSQVSGLELLEHLLAVVVDLEVGGSSWRAYNT